MLLAAAGAAAPSPNPLPRGERASTAAAKRDVLQPQIADDLDCDLPTRIGLREMGRKKFKSDAFETSHASAEALHLTGVIDKTTMRDFE
jgi:hypothetical protein